MNIITIYKQFPTQESCIAHLEEVRWNGNVTCPYCHSDRVTPLKKEQRHHCNACNTSFSVTVGTIFHKTKVDLQKWFLAVSLVLNARKGISARQLARDIEVTKDTAWSMLMRIRKAMKDDGDMLDGIVEADETYVGGKNKNKHSDKKTKGTQGRNTIDKTAFAGVLERGGKVRTKTVSDVSSKTLQTFISENVSEGSTMMTDEWTSYNGLDKKYDHGVVSHSASQYVDGIKHTNTIEGFWSLFKRGINGQYHHLSDRHMNSYLREFCFRYNNRDNDSVFDLVISQGVRI